MTQWHVDRPSRCRTASGRQGSPTDSCPGQLCVWTSPWRTGRTPRRSRHEAAWRSLTRWNETRDDLATGASDFGSTSPSPSRPALRLLDRLGRASHRPSQRPGTRPCAAVGIAWAIRLHVLAQPKPDGPGVVRGFSGRGRHTPGAAAATIAGWLAATPPTAPTAGIRGAGGEPACPQPIGATDMVAPVLVGAELDLPR